MLKMDATAFDATYWARLEARDPQRVYRDLVALAGPDALLLCHEKPGIGRKEVRTVLYMAALPAIRHNASIGRFWQRPRENGKVSRVAIVACMRKLLTILNAIVRTGKNWASAS